MRGGRAAAVREGRTGVVGGAASSLRAAERIEDAA